MAEERVNIIVRSELEAAGFIAVGCAENHFECLEDQKCFSRVRAVCGEDVVVGVDVRKESDGVWRRTVVVDAEGAVALSLDQPADGNMLLTPIALETLRALPVPEPEPTPPPPPSPSVDDEIRYGERPLQPIFWAGVIAAGAGVVTAGVAAMFAGIAEAERAEPTAPAEARVDAEERARLLWLGAGAGAVVAVTGAATACMNSDTAMVAPELRRWCFE